MLCLNDHAWWRRAAAVFVRSLQIYRERTFHPCVIVIGMAVVFVSMLAGYSAWPMQGLLKVEIG